MQSIRDWRLVFPLIAVVAFLLILGTVLTPTTVDSGIAVVKRTPSAPVANTEVTLATASIQQIALLFEREVPPLPVKPASPVSTLVMQSASSPEPKPILSGTMNFVGFVQVSENSQQFYFKDSSKNQVVVLKVGETKDGWTLVSHDGKTFILEKSSVKYLVKQK